MVVLIVDDQTNIVNGIYLGVNWNKIGVTQVLKAYNAYEAKEILKSQIVDIMLCDIEMPVESGLDLFRWVQGKQLKIECIFLTAHADFLYAKEAIQLGGFDYILQPAKYEDIERTVLKAIKKIKEKRETEKYSSYGKLLYNSRDQILQALLKEWFSGKSTNVKNVLKDIKSFNVQLTENSLVYLVILDIISDDNTYGTWDTPMLAYSLSNIISELFEAYGQQIILVTLEDQCFAIIIYPRENEIMDTETLKKQLETLRNILQKHFCFKIACYSGPSLPISELTERFNELKNMRDDNVAHLDNVFMLNHRKMICSFDYINQDMQLWNHFMDKGPPTLVLNEVLSYLEQMAEEGSLNAVRLKRFYQDFMQLISHMAECMEISVNQIFEGSEWLEKSLNSYTSITEMKKLIQYVSEYFESITISKQDAERQVDAIIQYIRSNIENDIRRSDIAKAVYLSPSYVSRIFKRVMNVSLKEYITVEKMKLAKALLKNTALPISMIAVKVGYCNFSHFSQVYKKYFGVTPAADRNDTSCLMP